MCKCVQKKLNWYGSITGLGTKSIVGCRELMASFEAFCKDLFCRRLENSKLLRLILSASTSAMTGVPISNYIDTSTPTLVSRGVSYRQLPVVPQFSTILCWKVHDSIPWKCRRFPTDCAVFNIAFKALWSHTDTQTIDQSFNHSTNEASGGSAFHIQSKLKARQNLFVHKVW